MEIHVFSHHFTVCWAGATVGSNAHSTPPSQILRPREDDSGKHGGPERWQIGEVPQSDPKEVSGSVWRPFRLSQLGRGCYWCLVTTGQLSIVRGTGTFPSGPKQRIIGLAMLGGPRLRNSAVGGLGSFREGKGALGLIWMYVIRSCPCQDLTEEHFGKRNEQDQSPWGKRRPWEGPRGWIQHCG